MDTVKVGYELGVWRIVQRSVRKAGGRVGATAQLIKAESGNQVRTDCLDGEHEDLLSIQDELSEAIVTTVEQEISNIEKTRAVHKHPENLRA